MKTSLKGEALTVISGFQLTADNYLLAYNALLSRFQNKRRIASMYLKRILNFKAANTSSLSNLKEFLDIHQTSVNAIKTLNFKDLTDFLFFSLALNNMDSHIQKTFENKHASVSIPTYDELIDFITQQMLIQEFSEPGSKPSPPVFNKPKVQLSSSLLATTESKTSTASAHPRNVTCPRCRGIHFLYNCPSYSN